MSYEYYHKGVDIDISRTNGVVSVHAVDDRGRDVTINVDDSRDIEVLAALLDNTVTHRYAESQAQVAADYEIMGC